jgi:hypothetical protein
MRQRCLVGAGSRPWIARGVVIASVLALMALAGAYLVYRWRGDGHVFVIAPADAWVKIRLGGGEPFRLPAGQLFGRDLPQGVHLLHLEREGSAPVERQLRIDEGGQRWVVPAADDQCFLEVDVSESAYGSGGAASITRRRGATPFRVSGSTYLRRGLLPVTRSGSEAVLLLHPVTCDELALDEASLLARVPR